MNKIKCSAVLVVEGKMDKDLIESFMDVDIITTNGSEVSRGTIDYIQEISKKDRLSFLPILTLQEKESVTSSIKTCLDV